MRSIATLVRKDFLLFLRNPTAVALTFFVPIALIYIFGQVFNLNRKGSPGPSGIKLAVVNASDHPAAQKLVAALEAEKSFRLVTTTKNKDGTKRPLTEADLRPMIRNHVDDVRFALVIPADVLPKDRVGLHLKILSDPRNDIETQMVNGLLQKTIFSNVPELLGESLQLQARNRLGTDRLENFNRTLAETIAQNFGGDPAKIQQRIEAGDLGLSRLTAPANPKPADPTLRPLDRSATDSAAAVAASTAEAATHPSAQRSVQDFFSRIVRIDREQVVGKDVKSPEATRVVGGWAIMFLLFAISRSSAAFFDEKNTGIFQRLLSAPLSRTQLMTSRFVFGLLLGLGQLVILFGAGQWLYGIDVLGHLGLLVLASTLVAAACTAFGMLVAAISPNASAANGLATFVVMIMSAIGGAWFPMSIMPPFMQTAGKFTLVYWSMESFSGVLWAGNSLLQLLPTFGILAGITAGVMALALWRLNHKAIFE